MAKSPRVLVLFNPTAQSGKAKDKWDEIQAACQSLGVEIKRFNTLPGGRTRDLVAGWVKEKRFDLMIGVGGDGTLTEIIQGIMEGCERNKMPLEDLPVFSLIPLGTGNNIAKSVGIDPGDGIQKALDIAIKGDEMLIDVGKVDGVYFADAFTIGMDPVILSQRNQDREAVSRIPLIKTILRDYFLYFWSFVKKIFTHKAVEATLWIDGNVQKIPNLYNLIVNNSPVYAGVFDFAKENSRALMQDGFFDLIFFLGRNDYISKLLIAHRIHPLNEEHFKKIMVKHTTNMRGKNIIIHLAHPVPSQIDGEEYLTKERFEISVIPSALRVKVPTQEQISGAV